VKAALVAMLCALAAPSRAAVVLVDLDDAEILDASGADMPIVVGRTLDLLVLEVVRERVRSGALASDDIVAVLPVAGDPGPALAARALPVQELVQLLLLTDSRTAARSLLAAVGAGEERGRARLKDAAHRLGLRRTDVRDDWPAGAAPRAGVPAPAASSAARIAVATTAAARGVPSPHAAAVDAGATSSLREVARLAIAVLTDPAMRRRLTLDGVPIANGALIVRASAPLIGLMDAPARSAPDETLTDVGPVLLLGSRDGLDLIAIASGAGADGQARAALARGRTRYERVEVVRAGQPVGRKVKVHDGVIPWFSAVAAQSFAVTVPRTRAGSLRLMLQLPAVVSAPLDREQPVGELVIARGERLLGAVPLVAPLAVAPSRWIDTAQQ
jgi:D-alanyl-D-alanine carboxypeptidase